MKVKILASGSTGNSYLLEGVKTRLLIDLGIKYNEIVKKCSFIVPPVALVTHSHMDHAKGVPEFLKNGGIVYGSTATAIEISVDHYNYKPIQSQKSFEVGEFAIMPIQMVHGVECLGFVITDGVDILLFFSDTDSCNYNLSGLTQLYVECNYSMADIDEETADKHAMATMQHMSLEDLILFLNRTDLSKVKKIVLIHNSESNLDKKKAIKLVQKTTGVPTYCASKNGGYYHE